MNIIYVHRHEDSFYIYQCPVEEFSSMLEMMEFYNWAETLLLDKQVTAAARLLTHGMIAIDNKTNVVVKL